MAFTSMHFGVGMGCAGLAAGAACLIFRRGWRWLPAGMTLGGVWAMLPDLPRLFREDFPSLPFAATLGDKSIERWLHARGDWFFFHHALDAQPKEFALHGLFLIVFCYNVAFAIMMLQDWWRRRRGGPELRMTNDELRKRAA